MAGTHDAPQSRNESILQNILGATNELTEPESRIEKLLIDLLNQSVPIIPENDGDYKLHVQDGVATWVLIS